MKGKNGLIRKYSVHENGIVTNLLATRAVDSDVKRGKTLFELTRARVQTDTNIRLGKLEFSKIRWPQEAA